MKVIKVLNNSLVLVVDNQGHEKILMGKAIGYNKSTGYKIKDSDIEKVFVLENKEISKRIIQLANEIDAKYFIIAKTIIDYAKERYQMNLQEYIYLSLTDHIAFTVRRIKDNDIISNLYSAIIRQLNVQEYEIGEFAVNLISNEMNMFIPEEEISNIASHFINAQKNQKNHVKNDKIIDFVNSVLNIVKCYFSIEYDINSLGYNRFVLHLQSFGSQIILGNRVENSKNDSVYTHIFDLYPEEKDCVNKLDDFIKRKYNIKISNQETLYLIIHLHKILTETGGKKYDNIPE